MASLQESDANVRRAPCVQLLYVQGVDIGRSDFLPGLPRVVSVSLLLRFLASHDTRCCCCCRSSSSSLLIDVQLCVFVFAEFEEARTSVGDGRRHNARRSLRANEVLLSIPEFEDARASVGDARRHNYSPRSV